MSLYAPEPAPRKPRSPLPPFWWLTRGRRSVPEEILYLIMFGPIDISSDERRLLAELWAKHRRVPRMYWPTQHQLAARFDVSDDSIERWVRHLSKQHTLTYSQPHNIPDGNGGWKGPLKHPNYELHAPETWLWKNDWRYLGARRGWVTPDGVIVPFPPDLFSFPKAPPRRFRQFSPSEPAAVNQEPASVRGGSTRNPHPCGVGKRR
jgi:hypothetical protein